MSIHYFTLLPPIIVPSSIRMTKQGKLKKEKKQGKLAWTMPGELEKVKEKKQCKLQKGDETSQGKQGKWRSRNKASRKRRRNKASFKMGRAAPRFNNNGYMARSFVCEYRGILGHRNWQIETAAWIGPVSSTVV